ncbi:GntR family transcriptional regulator [Sphaerisporangium perillae]|uniref:GntR family transcriptional regulator n=1 Tax=Sphaerisporangium perillae TaxID=2935860 RepID=UPI00200E5BA0|nr:GntR family transcriptional regulator [Sphaerisporangium perillae]
MARQQAARSRDTLTTTGEAASPAASSKAERAYRIIKDRIEDGTYGPGFRLVLDQLARELSVSAVPVREAIRRLESEGYVVFTRNLGASVASIDPDQYWHTMQVLAIVEAAATALAAPHLAARTLREAREVNERMRASIAAFDPVAFTQLNEEFHRLLCSACPNPRLCGLVKREWSQMALIRRSSFVFVPGRARASVAEHDQLLDLIESRASEQKIEQAARAHKLATLDAFIRHQP